MKKWSTRPRAEIAAIALGATLTLAFAPFECFPLAIIVPALLLGLWYNATPKRAFLLGFLFGVGLFTSGTYWIYISIREYGNVDMYLSVIITIGFISILSCYPALIGYLLTRSFPLQQPANMICAFPALWVVLEWVRSWLFTGFPWLFLGYSQTNSPLKGFAPLLGIYGVSLMVAISSSLIAYSFLCYRRKQYRTLSISLLAITTIWASGALLNLIQWTQPIGAPIHVSLIQANIPQSLKWSPDHLEMSLTRYIELTTPELKKNNLIIWPEAAVPIPLNDAEDFINALDEKALKAHANLILGIPIKATNGEGYYNAIATLGNNKLVYLKRRLVPFGEYVPFEKYVARIFDFMNVPMSNIIPGTHNQKALDINGVKILPAICFEITVPELMRTDDESVGLLLTITNDAWFGKSIAQAQHVQMALMRSIEFKRPGLFVGNDGLTAILSTDGKIEKSIPAHTVGVLNGTVQPYNGLTPWMMFGFEPMVSILLGLFYIARRPILLVQLKNNNITSFLKGKGDGRTI